MSKAKYCVDKQHNTFYISVFTLMLYGFSVVYMLYEYLKNKSATDVVTAWFAQNCLLFFILGLFYSSNFVIQTAYCKDIKLIFGWEVGKERKTSKKGASRNQNVSRQSNAVIKPFGDWWAIIIRPAIALFGLRVIIAVTAFVKIQQFNVTNEELFIFYVTGGMIEESLFRGTIQQNIKDTLNTTVFKGKSNLTSSAIAIGAASVAFSLSHITSYNGDITLMFGAIAAGVLLGIIYEVSNGDLIETMFAHGLSNLWSAYINLQQTGHPYMIEGSASTNIILSIMMLIVFLSISLLSRRAMKLDTFNEYKSRKFSIKMIFIVSSIITMIASALIIIEICIPYCQYCNIIY
jgi:membrane protease YdiL (CAAX protease family)